MEIIKGEKIGMSQEFRADGRVVPVTLIKIDKEEAKSLKIGSKVKVSGISKGKGFQGVVRRHGFAGGPATHGHKDNLRMPGAIGSGGLQRVAKGRKMAGRMGGQRVSVKNLEIIAFDQVKKILTLKGALPGARKSKLLIYV